MRLVKSKQYLTLQTSIHVLMHAHTHSLHIVFPYLQITASQCDELNGLSSPEFDKSHLEL